MKLITTSWDDGHVLDFKLADLLSKYNLPATFYIPQTNGERPVMGEKEIKTLSGGFEIGGHTLHHIRLKRANKKADDEIRGCHGWLSQLLGVAPTSFCFPGGVYNEATLQTVFKSGFTVARTTELFATAPFLRNRATPTTLQVYPHAAFTYAKHLAKRSRWSTLRGWTKSGLQTDLCTLTENYLGQISRFGGCFHLWGHSWEIEKYNLWKALENVFKILANQPGFSYVQNRGLAEQPVAPFAAPLLTTTNT